MRRIILLSLSVLALVFPQDVCGQSQNFKNGETVEIGNSIIKELLNNYVDTVKLDEILTYGIEAMLNRLDPYTVYIPEEEQEGLEMMISGTYGGIGAIIFKRPGEGVIINEPYEGSPATKAGLQPGDMILSIDGTDVYGLESAECSERMKGKPGTSVRFKVRKVRGGDTVDISVTRERIHLPDIEYAGMLDDTTGYLRLTGFTTGAAEDTRKEVNRLKKEGMKRLVFDLRGNGGGAMNEAVDILSIFLPKNTVAVTAKGRRGAGITEYRTNLEPVDVDMPLLVLIDGASASSAEIVAGAIQDLDRGLVMGTRSYGKGLVQSIRPLPYNGQLKITTARYYTPSGRCVQALDYSNRKTDGSVGYVPDSLRKDFKTLHGRTVKDGGGISPDVELSVQRYSRIVYSLVLNGIIEEYTLKYVSEHDSVPSPDDFHLSDAEFEDFVKFAAGKDFDYRSESKALLDEVKKTIKEEGLGNLAGALTDSLAKAVDLDKAKIIRYNKDQITPFIEEEIIIRYYFQPAGVKIRLRTDNQLHEALAKWNESLGLLEA
ncbi:MAG: S41 family peptidase [Bacteroidetes bacterium]|uniref:S41 family peptidase n=1 Tax=Candidatus Merdivivens pullistercoris TaxID=2840873 RepID=A0A9D9I488_9BACT|nr:S41 family peptidase [Candidatus Merdivivens pullistercoris]